MDPPRGYAADRTSSTMLGEEAAPVNQVARHTADASSTPGQLRAPKMAVPMRTLHLARLRSIR